MISTLIIASILSLVSVSSFALTQMKPNENTVTYSLEIERLLNQVFDEIANHQMQNANVTAEALANAFPEFLLGQLLHAEFSSMMAMDNTLIDSDQYFSPELLDLLMEAQSRVNRHQFALNEENLPINLLQLGADIDHVIAVDLEHSRLYLIDNRGSYPSVVTHHYAGSGRGGYGKSLEGDLRTPTGIYQVTRFRPDRTLPPLYGSGALTLDYPNAIDRINKRTGYGIWLHGIPSDSLSRGPRSSEGCVVMSNDLLTKLHQSVKLDRTLVLLSGELQWADRLKLEDEKESYLNLFNQFQTAWVKDKLNSLTAAYDPDPLRMPAATRISARSTTYELSGLDDVNPADVTVLKYPAFPGGNPISQLMMRFTLLSDHGIHRTVTLFWEQRADDRWQIVHVNEEKDPV